MRIVLLLLLFFKCVEGNSAGILYEVWHTKAADTMREVKARGGLQLTTETVIRSAGKHTLNDVYAKYGLGGDIYNVEPHLGFYCFYRKRANDTNPPVKDCLNISGTAEAHANMLVAAGFDYIAVDITNWPQVNAATDLAVLRPTEVLFEEWAKLRAAGKKTPQIAVWPCSPKGSNTWKYLMDHLYNNASYDSLVYRYEGKKAVFLPDNPTCFDASTEALIRANGGLNDVTTIKMWALFGPNTYKAGTWGFFSPCLDGGKFTTSMVGAGECDQYATTAPDGHTVEISASGGYMLSQCALPFASPGHMRGLTLQRLFKKILEEKPPNLFMSSFNEHIGGRQAPAYHANTAFNMGLPNDPQKDSVWVDTYAAEFSRDIEPTHEAGGKIFAVASSCVQLYKAGLTCAGHEHEACCTTADKEVFANVWSLVTSSGNDHLLTNSSYEKSVLVKEGWKEVCNPVGGPSVFCVDGSMKDGRPGPFMIYSVAQENTKGLFRCMEGNTHFVSTDPLCEGQKVEFQLGYVATQPGGEMLRALSRCLNKATGIHSHALDLPCDAAQHDTGILGYVR